MLPEKTIDYLTKTLISCLRNHPLKLLGNRLQETQNNISCCCLLPLAAFQYWKLKSPLMKTPQASDTGLGGINLELMLFVSISRSSWLFFPLSFDFSFLSFLSYWAESPNGASANHLSSFSHCLLRTFHQLILSWILEDASGRFCNFYK